VVGSFQTLLTFSKIHAALYAEIYYIWQIANFQNFLNNVMQDNGAGGLRYKGRAVCFTMLQLSAGVESNMAPKLSECR
jgi:hypothetical protein